MKPKLVTVCVMAALCGFLLLRHRSISAADTESLTWGAVDPAWSPDGTRLAFSLFGSIWQAPASGGEAQQISTSAGYHAHPAWSPKGDRVAFVSGAAPAGPLPNIGGKLTIVDVASGEERELATPQPVAGTLAWSPQGDRIACGLQVPNAGSLLHEIAVEGGGVRQLQQRPQRGLAGNWIDLAWSARHNELFFAASRLGPPQIWSMPAGRPPIFVQLPLTAYRREQIVQLHSLSAAPDGASVVYSAVEVNGKGDRDLYRVGREGGKPVAITNTPRDEFSPAVSPDGRRIAHVSNHLGNVDLFVMPAAGGEKTHVRLSGLKFRKPSARVRVKVVDELGAPTPARLYVRAADGKAYAPPGSSIFYYPLEPGGPREGFFLSSGDDEFPVPAGPLRLVALKGVEYQIAESPVAADAGRTTAVTLQMVRWTNWNQRGWYTGENHFHANYNGSYYQRPAQSLAWLQAEDLNTANMIVANSEGAFVHDKEFFTGGVHTLSGPRYVLYWGQEYRNSDPLGHMAFLNIKKQVPPSYTSVIGSDSPWDFPLNTMGAQEARKQGGVVIYVHPIGGAMTDVFDTGLGAKEAPVTAALDAMDGIDVLPFGEAAYELWYRLLNCGFRLAPGAGTDVFTNWRGINNIPGGSRQYVQVGSAMSWDRWVTRYREGRAFVTNGPLMDFQVNGQPPGSLLRVPAGAAATMKLAVEVTARVPLRSVEFLRNGEVVETSAVDPSARSFRMEKEVAVDRSSWFAARVTGRPARGIPGAIPRAHSGAVWVHVGDKPVLVRQDLELMIRWVNRLWAYLEERNNLGPGDNRDRARRMFDQALAHYRNKLAQSD